MVYDDVASIEAAQTVRFALRGLTWTEPHVADDDVRGRNRKIPVCHADSVSGCCLSGYGDIAVTQFQLRFQVYGAADIEHNGSCATLFACPPQRTGA